MRSTVDAALALSNILAGPVIAQMRDNTSPGKAGASARCMQPYIEKAHELEFSLGIRTNLRARKKLRELSGAATRPELALRE